jgi:hypothetical protein
MKRFRSPKLLGLESQMARAEQLASMSVPMVADLYRAHLQACELAAARRKATRRGRDEVKSSKAARAFKVV